MSIHSLLRHAKSAHPNSSNPYLPPFPAAAALLVVRLPAAGAGSGSLGGASAPGVRLRLAAGFALVLLGAASGRGKAGSSREGALRLRDVLEDVGGGLGTTIGETGFGFGVVMVVAVVVVVDVVERVDFDLPRVVGVKVDV
jgi:hypothetical protein